MAFILQKDGQRRGSQLTQSLQKFEAEIPPHNITTAFTEGAAEGPTMSETVSMASTEALDHLLDLKQKHATVTEARFAGKRADEMARQGATIMFFTIATIIFGSISFVTAFFALNVTAFPTAWTLGHIVSIVASSPTNEGEPITSLVLSIGIVFRPASSH